MLQLFLPTEKQPELPRDDLKVESHCGRRDSEYKCVFLFSKTVFHLSSFRIESVLVLLQNFIFFKMRD